LQLVLVVLVAAEDQYLFLLGTGTEICVVWCGLKAEGCHGTTQLSQKVCLLEDES